MAKFNLQGKIIERTSSIHHSSGEDITASNGLPVQLTGSNVPETVKIYTGRRPWTRVYDTAGTALSVNASTTTTFSVNFSPVKLKEVEQIIASVKPDVAHAYKLYISLSHIASGASGEAGTITIYDSTAANFLSATPTDINYIKGSNVEDTILTFAIQNKDSAATHTYHIGIAAR